MLYWPYWPLEIEPKKSQNEHDCDLHDKLLFIFLVFIFEEDQFRSDWNVLTEKSTF